MAKKSLPSLDVLHSLLIYEPEEGKFYWKSRPQSMFPSARMANTWNSRYANKEAFTAVNAQGYKAGKIFDTNCKAHRIAWKMTHGVEPPELIDHINGDRIDNRISNLRPATYSENRINTRGARGASGFKGVIWSAQRDKWIAEIKANGVRKYLGSFENPEEASAAYKTAAKCLHGEFACSESGEIK